MRISPGRLRAGRERRLQTLKRGVAFGGTLALTLTSLNAMIPGRDPLRVLSIAIVLSTAVLAQTPPATENRPATKESGAGPTFRTDVRVVLVPVVVRDSAGRPVGNLKAEDFQLYDKGKIQTIGSFSVITRDSGGERLNGNSATAAIPGEAPPDSAKPDSAAGKKNLQRSVVYLFDDMNTRPTDFAALRQAALRHFDNGLPASDTAAIYTFSGRTTLEFTSDGAKLEEAVTKLRVRPVAGHGDASPCPDVGYYLAQRIEIEKDERALEAVTRQTMDCMSLPHHAAQNVAESEARRGILIGAQDTHVWIATLRSVIRLLGQRPGQRAIVLASSGFFAQTPDGIRGLADTLDLAARANVAISTLDARGVFIASPADASRSSAPGSLEQQYYRERASADETVLADLAEGSGGSYFRHNNDLTAGFAQLAAPPEISYLIGFSPSSLKADGSFHTLKVRLSTRKGASIQARRGYFALNKGRTQDAVGGEVDEAVFARDETTSIPLDVISQISRSGTASARLSVVTRVHVKSLRFQNVDGRNRDALIVVSAIFDEDGGYVEGSRSSVNLMLRNETLEHTDDPGVNVQSNFNDMKPGTYLVRIVVRENGGSALSTRNVRVVVR